MQVYCEAWQFQNKHRAALVTQGLQRRDIGAIASAIGQLYYNFYLRTGATSFLLESYSFYEIVRARQYFLESPTSASSSVRYLRCVALLKHAEHLSGLFCKHCACQRCAGSP